MAPILNLMIQLLPSLSNKLNAPIHTLSYDNQSVLSYVDQQQQKLISDGSTSISNGAMGSGSSSVSTISWGQGRLDAFSLTGNNLTQKAWVGEQWYPSDDTLETLGNGLATAPAAVTWGTDRLDVFGLDDHNVVKHQYWDSSAWRPDVAEFENLGGECDSAYPKPVAASSWGAGRLDVFCTGPERDLLHQYYDGSDWQPSAGSLESLGGSLASSPSVVSWGKNRLDIFAVDPNGDLAHLYWDGSQWSQWETLPFLPNAGIRANGLTVTSWGENRLDVYGVAFDASLYHKYWDGYQWSPWEKLGGERLLGAVAATSWSANRLDIVAKGGKNATYWYKFYDGQAWRPDATGWYPKGADTTFSSDPSVVSWGENRLDIFGVDAGDKLLHQTWYGSGWYPGSTDWETLASGAAVVDGGAKVTYEKTQSGFELRR